MFMIRRGAPQVCQLRRRSAAVVRPEQRIRWSTNNLAASKKHGKERVLRRRSVDEVGWRGLRQSVLESQRARRLVHRALTIGRIHPWDFSPTSDAASAYYRNYGAPDAGTALAFP